MHLDDLLPEAGMSLKSADLEDYQKPAVDEMLPKW
jgi:hypothetical protein